MKNNIELRDYFAGCALQGLLANSYIQREQLKDMKRIEKEFQSDKFSRSDRMQYELTLASYGIADAMLKNRDKK